MTAQSQQLVGQALSFPPEERRQIAGALLQSMADEDAPQFPAETVTKIQEVHRRYHAGEEPTIPGEEFKAHLKQLSEKFRAQDQGAQIV